MTELNFDENKVRFNTFFLLTSTYQLKFSINSLPYAPDGKTTPKFEVPTSKEGKYSKDVGYGLKIDVFLDMTSFIKSVSSPSHPISFEFGDDPNHAHVKLANEDGTPLVKDFELAITLAKPHEYII